MWVIKLSNPTIVSVISSYMVSIKVVIAIILPLVMNGMHHVHAMFTARRPYNTMATHHASGDSKPQFDADCAAGCSPTRTRTIRIRRVETLDSRWMTAMRSLKATMMRQLGTLMSTAAPSSTCEKEKSREHRVCKCSDYRNCMRQERTRFGCTRPMQTRVQNG